MFFLSQGGLMRNVSLALLFTLAPFLLSVGIAPALWPSDEDAIRKIISEQVAAWNAGDAKAYARYFAPDGSFTNIYGMAFDGHEAFEKRHAETFATFFKGSNRQERIRRIRFMTSDVAIIDVETQVRNFGKLPPGIQSPPDGVLRTRLLLVFVRRNRQWWIEAYHNVDVKQTGSGLEGGLRAPIAAPEEIQFFSIGSSAPLHCQPSQRRAGCCLAGQEPC
jgi:uncharacterized protein (TIGR02246 family)